MFIGWSRFCNSNGPVGNKGHPAVVNRRKLDDLLLTFKRVREGRREREKTGAVDCPEASSGGEAYTYLYCMYSNEQRTRRAADYQVRKRGLGGF